MSDDLRKTVIIDEINYWKKHKLLPEKQCDFLLALYTQGESPHNKGSYTMNPIIILLLILLIPLSLVVIYLFQLPFYIKIALLLIFIAFALWNYKKFQSFNELFNFIALITVLLLTLFITVYMANFFKKETFIITLIIVSNFIYWYILAKRQNISLLANISMIALIFTFIYIIYKFI